MALSDVILAASLNNLAELATKKRGGTPMPSRCTRGRWRYGGSARPDNPLAALALNYLAELYREQGRYPEAEPLFKEALAIRRAVGRRAKEPGQGPLCSTTWPCSTASRRRYADAEPLFKEALAIDREPCSATTTRTRGRRAQQLGHALLREEGRYADAEPLFKEALEVRSAGARRQPPDTARQRAITWPTLYYEQEGRYADAEPLFKEALAIFEKALGPDHPSVASALNNLASLYKSGGQ